MLHIRFWMRGHFIHVMWTSKYWCLTFCHYLSTWTLLAIQYGSFLCSMWIASWIGNAALRIVKLMNLWLLWQLYCRRRGGEQAARSFVRAVRKGASVVTHYNLYWGAAFLVCRFATDPCVVEFRVSELLVLSRKLVVPLALRSFNTFSRCVAALEILRMCYVMLEDVEKSFVSQVQNRWDQSLCWRRANSGPNQVKIYYMVTTISMFASPICSPMCCSLFLILVYLGPNNILE